MDQEVKAALLLEFDNKVDFFLDEIIVLVLSKFALAKLGTSLANFLGLLSTEISIDVYRDIGPHTGKEPMVVVGNLGRLRAF